MERRKAIKLEDLINPYLREEGIETPLNEFRAVRLWGELVEPTLKQQISGVQLRGGVLRVKLKSAALRADLSMKRNHYVQLINKAVGSQVVSDIVFY